jgi:glycosyltransferase involved in cell wall biosynthesis
MKKLLFIAPHLSTGGMPQYLVKQIEIFKNEYDVYCVEWNSITGGVLVVQRNRIQNMLGDKLITLGEDKSSIINIINDINPDIIHFQEIPESFIDSFDLLNIIYRDNRNYFILVTTHSSYTDPKNIKFAADKFILVSEWSKNRFVDAFGEDMCGIWEYPIEKKPYDKDFYKKELQFDLDKKHILHVGLFTPGKNQRDIIELARLCKDDNFVFHFVGNQAENFRGYWEPLMAHLPDNCIWHNERDDVDKFYMASDLFYFPSLFELNPLSVKEALSYSLPVMINNLEIYNGSYDHLGQISTNQHENRNKIIDILNDIDDTVVLVLAHPNNEKNKQLLKNCLSGFEYDVILSTNYKVDEETQEMCDHILYMRENQLLFYKDYEKYGVGYKYWYVNELGEKYEQFYDCNHSYAVYRLIQNGINYAKMIGKKKIHIINYDYEISNSTLSYINSVLSEKDLMFYRDGDLYLTGFFSGNIDPLLTYFNKHNNIRDFYTAFPNFNTLEIQVYDHFTNSEYTIESKDISELYIGNKVNQYEYDSKLVLDPERVY